MLSRSTLRRLGTVLALEKAEVRLRVEADFTSLSWTMGPPGHHGGGSGDGSPLVSFML